MLCQCVQEDPRRWDLLIPPCCSWFRRLPRLLRPVSVLYTTDVVWELPSRVIPGHILMTSWSIPKGGTNVCKQ